MDSAVSSADLRGGARLGFFFPISDLSEIYGAGPTVDLEALVTFGPGIGLGISTQYWRAEGTPITFGDVTNASSDVSIVFADVYGLYRIQSRGAGVIPYFGAGVGVLKYKEKARATFPQLGSITLPSVSKNPFSLGARVGLEIPQAWGAVTVEARFATAKMDSEIVLLDPGLRLPAGEVKIEGLTLLAGVRW